MEYVEYNLKINSFYMSRYHEDTLEALGEYGEYDEEEVEETEDEEESDDVNKDLQILDPLFLNTPALALEHCKNAANEMANYAKESMMYAMDLFEAYDEKNAQHVVELESIVDKYEDQLGTYLVKLSSQQLTEKDSQELSSILHCMGDFERISDHAVNVMESAKEMHDKELSFSKKAEEELEVFTRAMKDIINTTIKVYVVSVDVSAS